MGYLNEGGPAFARPASEYTEQGTLQDGNDAIDAQDGMSVLDYFAAAALQDLLAGSDLQNRYPDPDEMGERCYEYAAAAISAKRRAESEARMRTQEEAAKAPIDSDHDD